MKQNKKLIVIIIIIIIYLILRLLLNEISIIMYNSSIYNSIFIKPLYILNFPQPYIAYYNNGNFNYKNQNYDIAIKNYQKALNLNPPKSKICNIQINLSLASIYNIDSNDQNYILNQLELAKNYLYENDCAHPLDNNGFSKGAEQLKNEINQLIKKLMNEDENNSYNNNEENIEQNEENYNNIEQEILKNEKEANSNRQEDLNTYENMGNYDYYSGKRW